MQSTLYRKFLMFLRVDLDISADAIKLVSKEQDLFLNQLPIVLWQYGFVTLPQVDQIFDWLSLHA